MDEESGEMGKAHEVDRKGRMRCFTTWSSTLSFLGESCYFKLLRWMSDCLGLPFLLLNRVLQVALAAVLVIDSLFEK